MNNEFKKVKIKNETRYVLETASAGATSASDVATAPGSVKMLQRRLSELKDKVSVPVSKPRNPVGMGSTQGRGTQKHQSNQRQKSRDEKKLYELETPSGQMFLKFRGKRLPNDEMMVLAYGGFGTTPKDVTVANAKIKPFAADEASDVISHIRKILNDKDFIGVEKIVLDIPNQFTGQLRDIIDYADRDERLELYTGGDEEEPEAKTGGKVIGIGPDGKRINRDPAKAQVGGSSRGIASTGMVTVQASSDGQRLVQGLISQNKLSRDTKVQGNKITFRKDDYSKMMSVLGNDKFQQLFNKVGSVAEAPVNELSKDTLRAYSKAAGREVGDDQRDSRSARDKAIQHISHGELKKGSDWSDEADWLNKRAEKRASGIARATSKIAQKGVAEGSLNEFAQGDFNGGDGSNDLQLYLSVAKKLNMKRYKPSTANNLIAKKMAELVDVVDDDKVDWARHMARKAQGLPNMLDQHGLAEGKFTINAKTGAKLDPRTGKELPPKENSFTMKDMFRQPKPTAPKLTLDDVWRKVEDVVGQIFPDGDPIDWLLPWFRKQGIADHKIGGILERAAKKNGYKDIYDYYNSMKDQYARDNVAEGLDSLSFWKREAQKAGGAANIDWYAIGVEHGKQGTVMNPPYGVGGKAVTLYGKGLDAGKQGVAENPVNELSTDLLNRTRDAASQRASMFRAEKDRIAAMPWQQSLAPDRLSKMDQYDKASHHYVGLSNKARLHKSNMSDKLTAQKMASMMPAKFKNANKSAEEDVEEGLRDPKDNPCWKGYKPVGTKKKNGKTVPNCVPTNEDNYFNHLTTALESKLKK
jgi:hypothetical protein